MQKLIQENFRLMTLTLSLLTLNFIAIGLFATYYIKPKTEIRAQATNTRPIIVDHTSIELFDQIPENYLEAARNLAVVFSDRSVGQNTYEALSCLTATSWDKAPAYCRRDYIDMAVNWTWKTYNLTDFNAGNVPSRILFTPDPVKYSRSNITYATRSGSWQSLTQNFIQDIVPTYLNSKDVITYQFSYLNVDTVDNIADPTVGFFAANPGDPTKWDISDIEAFEQENPTKTFIYWTSSLSRNIGTQVSTDFNNQMRAYVQANNKILFDFADIESHDDLGNLCVDNRDGVEYCSGDNCENHPDDGVGIPAICQDYTTESDGGHLGSVSAARIRIAKAYWVLMAQVAGWDPGVTGTNQAPVVTVGTDQTVPMAEPLSLEGTVTDDGLPVGVLDVSWTNESEGEVVFSDPSSSSTQATFSQAGDYTLRLTASDGDLFSSDTLVVTVVDGPVTPTVTPTSTPTSTPTNTPTETPTPTITPTSIPVSDEYYLDLDSVTDPGVSCSGCVVNDVTLMPGVLDNSFGFNGASSSVTIGTLGLVKAKNAFTISAWIKPDFDETYTSSSKYLFSDGTVMSIFYLPNIRDFRTVMRIGSTNYRLDTVGLDWDPDTWHMLSFTYDGASMKFYWDGQLKSVGNASGYLANDTNTAKLGASPVNATRFSGDMDEFRIFSRALSTEEVNSLYLGI